VSRRSAGLGLLRVCSLSDVADSSLFAAFAASSSDRHTPRYSQSNRADGCDRSPRAPGRPTPTRSIRWYGVLSGIGWKKSRFGGPQIAGFLSQILVTSVTPPPPPAPPPVSPEV